MLLAFSLTDCFVRIFRWLCVDHCSTAAVMLSMSFGINSVFTGLAFSRFNLFSEIKRKALSCVQRSTNPEFLDRVKELARTDEKLRAQLSEYREIIEEYQEDMTTGSEWWEWIRRSVAILCAMAAFIGVAFECKVRLGFCLVLPYVFLLIWHFIWVADISWRVVRSFKKLSESSGLAKQS